MDMLRDIRELTQRMAAPILYDERCLKHLTRHAMGTDDFGVWLPRPDSQRYRANAVELEF